MVLIHERKKRHPLSRRFHELLEEIGELHDKKSQDYGRETDPFSNIRASSEWGILPWVGALLRGGDKFKRLQKFARDGSLANEPAVDSFKDLAVYALIGLVLYEEQLGLFGEVQGVPSVPNENRKLPPDILKELEEFQW